MKYAKQYFDNHSTVDVLYFTSDNLAFFEEQNAINHAAQLEDDTVIEITREEAESEFDDPDIDNPEYDETEELDGE